MANAMQEITNETTESTVEITTTNETTSTMHVRNYGERSFVVLGNTKPFSSSLRSLGGKFNKFLNVDGQKVPGWVFSKKHTDAVNDFVTRANDGGAPDVTTGVPVMVTGGETLPTVEMPQSNSYQTFHYKVYRPTAGMRVSLRADGKTLREGRVVKTTSSNGNLVDTVYIDFDGNTSMGTVCWGRWVIFGYTLEGHSLFFH